MVQRPGRRSLVSGDGQGRAGKPRVLFQVDGAQGRREREREQGAAAQDDMLIADSRNAVPGSSRDAEAADCAVHRRGHAVTDSTFAAASSGCGKAVERWQHRAQRLCQGQRCVGLGVSEWAKPLQASQTSPPRAPRRAPHPRFAAGPPLTRQQPRRLPTARYGLRAAVRAHDGPPSRLSSVPPG